MQPMDDPDFFKYSASKARRAPTPTSHINTYVTVFQYNQSTKGNQNIGQFILALVPQNQNTPKLTIYKQGDAPLLAFNLSKTINWTLQNNVYCYLTDPSGNKWLIQFADAAQAMHSTAAIGFLLSYQGPKEIAYYEPPQTKDPRVVSMGDRIKIHYYCYQISEFPFIDQSPVSFKDGAKFILARDKMPAGWVSGIIGMSVNNFRVIFVPQIYTALESGNHDPKFPNTNLIIVTVLEAMRSHQDDHQVSDTSDTSEPVAAKQATPPKTSTPVQSPEPSSEPPDQSEPSEKGEEPQEDPEEAERRAKLSKIMKTGGVAVNPFAGAFVPKHSAEGSGKVASMISRLADETKPIPPSDPIGSPPKHQQPASVPVPEPSEAASPPVRPNPIPIAAKSPHHSVDESSGDIMQKLLSIEAKLDQLNKTNPRVELENEQIIRGVQQMAVELKVRQSEIEKLKKQPPPQPVTQAPVSAVINRQLDTAVKESEELRRKLAAAERKTRDLELQLRQKPSGSTVDQDEVKTKAIGLVRKMMSAVFDDVIDAFPEDESFNGVAISEKLKELMKTRSFELFDQFKGHGLFQ